MSNVTLERRDGDLVAVKHADSATKLSDEAGLLARLRHPGVVELVALTDEDPPALLTVWAGTDTWDRRSPTSVTDALHSLAAIAATINDLHSAGIAHRSLSADHIIVANDGRPVLCGLGRAGPADQGGVDADRIGLRRLVGLAIDSVEPEDPRHLTELADLLDNPKSALRDFLHTIESFDDPPPPRLSHRLPVRIPNHRTIALGLLAVLAAMWALSSLHTSEPPPDDASTTSPSTTSLSTTSLSTAPGTTTSVVAVPPPVSSPTLGTPARSFASQQLVIEHAGRRYGLGASADSVVIGDWNCDGLPTPALLQRSTGIVAVFNAWPESGESRIPEYTTVESDAEVLVSEATAGCDRLRARGPYGSTIITPEQP